MSKNTPSFFKENNSPSGPIRFFCFQASDFTQLSYWVRPFFFLFFDAPDVFVLLLSTDEAPSVPPPFFAVDPLAVHCGSVPISGSSLGDGPFFFIPFSILLT